MSTPTRKPRLPSSFCLPSSMVVPPVDPAAQAAVRALLARHDALDLADMLGVTP